MNFKEALQVMKSGEKVKLPNWAGYWAWENGTIMMHTKDGIIMNLLDTELPEYTFDNIASDEFIIANEDNTPICGGNAYFGFGDAIKLVKRGLKLARKGWNGKNQHIELATNISYKNASNEVVNVEHNDMGNKAIAFVGTSGVQLGWLASQSDMLSDDWTLVD